MQRYELLGRNGAGANSTVYKCRDVASGGVVAVKKLEGAPIQQVLQEAAIMRVCDHPHIVSLLEAHLGLASGVVYLVMEHVEHALARELLLNPRGLPLPKTKLVAYQLASALEFVHGRKVCHGDLKPANVLLTSQYSVKLIDFGSASSAVLLSGQAGDGVAGNARAAPGVAPPLSALASSLAPKVTAAASRWYCAPESLLGSEGSPASDIWAFGCILAELALGKPLMPGGENELDQLCWVMAMIGRLSEAQEQLLRLLPREQRAKLDEARARGPLLDRIPKFVACPPLAELLRACLQPDPAKRPTAQQLQVMPLFEDVRQALQASEAAAAASQAAAAALASASAPGGGGVVFPPRPRRTSSGEMEVDVATVLASTSPEVAMPCGAAAAASSGTLIAAAYGSVSPPAAPAGAAAGAAQPLRRVSGVQAAAPVRPVSKVRVSALTATIRGNPFEGDGGYADLMPQVLRIAAMWDEALQRESLGPIALAARRSCSTSPAASLAAASMPSNEASLLGARLPSGAIAAALAAAEGNTPPVVEPIAAPAAAAAACMTPIAAAAGGCLPAVSTAVESSATANVAGGFSSPADCKPSPRAAPAAVAAAAAGLPAASKLSAPLSASVGAVPYMVKAAGIAAPCDATRGAGGAAAAGAAAVRAQSPALLRSRAVVNRARRHHSREPCSAGSMPSGLHASCSPRGLGSSATLMQRERAAAVAAPPPPPPPGRHGLGHGAGAVVIGLYRYACHASRRSFADLSDLASVAEYEALPCDTPPDVKRVRRAFTHHARHSSQPSVGSFNSLLTEASLGSLQDKEPVLFACGAVPVPGGAGGGRRLRRSSSGTGLAVNSPALRAAWQQLLPGAAAREASLPQPIAGRNRCGGGPPARGLAASISSDLNNSAASEAYLRGELA